MESKKRYVICESDSSLELEDMIASRMEEGYFPIGGVSFTERETTRDSFYGPETVLENHYAQAMIWKGKP